MRYAFNHRLRRVTAKVAGDIQARIEAQRPALARAERDAQWERAPGMRPLPEDEDTRPIRLPRGTQQNARRLDANGVELVPVNGPLECACGEPKNWWEAQCGLCAHAR